MPYDLPPLAGLLSRCGDTGTLGEPTAPLLCLASISCPNKVLSSALLNAEKVIEKKEGEKACHINSDKLQRPIRSVLIK